MNTPTYSTVTYKYTYLLSWSGVRKSLSEYGICTCKSKSHKTDHLFLPSLAVTVEYLHSMYLLSHCLTHHLFIGCS